MKLVLTNKEEISMAENAKNVADTVKEVMEATAPDAPKKNAVAAETSPLSNSAEDLGAPVVKPTDSNPDATKKVKTVSGQAPQAHAGSADAMPKLKEEDDSEAKDDKKKTEVEEGEMPQAALDALKKSGKDVTKKDDKEDVKEESEDDFIDVSADVAALTKDEDLSEEFKTKAATIFEAAVNANVKEARLEEQYKGELAEEVQTIKSDLVEKVDSYLNYVVESWMEDNKVAVFRKRNQRRNR